MIGYIFTPLQMREIFHLEFLRWLARTWDTKHYCIKGGVNLRLFFKSIRYSEDMDIDISGMRVERVKKTVLDILAVRGFSDSLRSYGVERIVLPDLTKAKQTETTQRFKIHLITSAGEDLFTKIEFSRRGAKEEGVVESVSAEILRPYKMAALLVPHYNSISAIQQKIRAIAQRSVLRARDVFDLFILSSQYGGQKVKVGKEDEAMGSEEAVDGAGASDSQPSHGQKQGGLDVSQAVLNTAHDHIFKIEFPQFRDTVVAYLEIQDQTLYSSSAVWDEIKLKTVHFLESFRHENN